jgi:hypothetical protein
MNRSIFHFYKFWIACVLLVIVAGGRSTQAQQADKTITGLTVLSPEEFHPYIERFRIQEQEATGKLGDDSWPWMLAQIPWFASSNKQFEEMYYFRWYAWQKHLVMTRHGHLITEWLPKPEMPDGNFGALPDAAAFHMDEARWLRDKSIAEDYASYWLSYGADPRKYSFWAASAVLNISLANGDQPFSAALLPSLKDNYHAWEKSNQDSNGLFWSIDTRDAMEKSISGDGYRPTLNSYIFGDAVAISKMAAESGDTPTADEFSAKAAAIRSLIENKLWNPKDNFYEVMSPGKDSGIRTQKRFIDPGTMLTLSGVRELNGYIPWQFDEPPPDHAVAWKQLFDPSGFAAKYGPLTAERRSLRFRFASNDQCTWNGPSWPFATTQTLLALANLLNSQKQPYVSNEDYYHLFSEYVLSQHRTLANGDVIPWIDEDLDGDTDEWIAKDMLIAKKSPQVGRGNYYNHSGFADPLITGLIGLRPRDDNRVVIRPLLPDGEWSWFAIDGLPYHGHLLSILYDATGKQFRRGRGLILLVDGKIVVSRPSLGPLEYRLSVEKHGK